MRAVYLLLGCVTLGCGEAVGPDSTPDRPLTLGLEDFVFQAPNGQRIPAQRGRLWLDAANGTSNQAVWFVRLPAKTETPAEPFVYLAGGPGGSGLATANGNRFGYFDRLRDVADVILYDQRGTGWSTPLVNCNRMFALPINQAVTRAEAAAMWTQQAGQCATDLRDRGVDLTAYNTERNADDVDAVREALSIEKINVIGYSYGTHLALSYIRRHGEHVARAILHGVEGPDHTLKLPNNVQRQLELIESLAATSPRGNAITPFITTLADLLNQLETKPESVFVDDTLVVFGKFEAQVLVSSAIGDRSDIEELPGVIQVIRNIGWTPVGPAILELKRAFMNSGMSYATDCASGASVNRLNQIAAEAPNTLLGDAINFPFPEICNSWDVPDLGDQFRSPIQSDVPVLLISGSIDGRTPRSNAEEIAIGFSDHRHLTVELGGHNDLATDLRIADAVRRWVSGDGSVPDVVQLAPLTFRVFQ